MAHAIGVGRAVVTRRRALTRRRGVRLAVASAVAACALLVQGVGVTNASWTDPEWDRGTIGTTDCGPAATGIASRGEGRVLSGAILGADLDTLLAARGVSVTNTGSRDRHTPSSAQPVPGSPQGWADPLNVALLNDALALELTSALQLPLGAGTGAAGQFGQAENRGRAAAASGYLTSGGGINLDGAPAGYPNLATLRLSQVLGSLNHPLGTLIPGITDVSLTAGAVAGRADLDACDAAWTGLRSGASGNLSRNYLTSHLSLDLTSPTVGALVTGVTNTVTTLETTVNGIAGNAGVTNAIASGVTGLLNGLIGGNSSSLSLGNITVGPVTATVNTAPLRTFIAAPFGDPGGILTVRPGNGTISVNTTALLAAAYPGSYGNGLNGLAPNTNPLADPAVLTTLTNVLTQTLSAWVASVNTMLTQTINGIAVNAAVVIDLRAKLLITPWIHIGTIQASTSGTLAQLLTPGNTSTTASLTLLKDLGLVADLVNGLLKPVLNSLVTGLIGGLGGVVGNAIEAVLGTLRVLPVAVSALATPIITAVTTLYSRLFLSGIVALTVNAQNDPFTGGPEPPDWAALPTGRYDVAALRIGVLDALGGLGVRLYLGRASVGPGCTAAQAAGGGCAGY
ncbi:hypothetical protein D3230_13790 [Leucobacter chromiireducens subsp. solipictus]|uniref:Choice-of-anchor G family protein n=1 Tax=Leucobacter chromiireducens subsp. solipictus TaxID=398235 RepID=A0ABS1SIF8_9MICO|nr:choice-of-anchor G family protein [Leucobacter chromiireducens]MBL3680351.1 hypothetical protein [Leucobacter chromiireducens subsp. solipictus]